MLTMTELQRRAPSIFALEPWESVSEKYRFVPTSEVVQALEEKGFVPVSATQSKCRIEGKENFTKHMIRFRHAEFADVSGSRALLGVPEIVLVNSHDRTSAYQIMLGMFRQVCQNGLIAFAEDLGFTVRHSGSQDLTQQVIDASYRIIEAAPQVTSNIQQWHETRVTPKQQEAYAMAALELRDSPLQVDLRDALKGRRHYDDARPDGSRDIWTTFNVVQENIIRGGMRGVSEKSGKRMKTRAVKSVDGDIKMNRALWRLTEELAKAV